MSGTSATPANDGVLKCGHCSKTVAKADGIKCKGCGHITQIPQVEVHFYPGKAIGGGSMEECWRDHLRDACVNGCEKCGILPGGKWAHSEPEPVVPPTGSHSLAARYTRVPATLDRAGTNYDLPDFGTADSQMLKGARVLVISADGPELPEIDVPMQYLRDRGADVKLAGQDWIFKYRTPAGHIVLAEWLTDDICVQADLGLSDANIAEYDALFIPGGAWNPDMLRGDDAALKLVRDAHRQGVLVVSLCHGPQVIINAAFDAPEGQQNFPAAGVHITGTGSIRLDLKNAGFVVHNDDATVYDERAGLLTARDPRDLQALCEEMGRLLKKRLAAL